ncbi:MAG: adenylyl-sulfate kinase [Holophagales bacterium]|jgi:adenylyl-sulfate kinase|nr:adenylyl-sulfate kinase [Holophagales bacterium]MBK9966732.1 adenylyl-sulfate kinase [Holophagales bacterium]
MSTPTNLHPHDGTMTAEDRERTLGQKGCVVWLTGLSGSGKSTVARALEARLASLGVACYVLDGDGLRTGLNAGLGFSDADRRENVRRAAEVAAILRDAGLVAIVSLISPHASERDRARELVGADRFVEVFLDAPLAACEARDPKGLYAKARAGEIPSFTGVSAPYEAPSRPDVVLRSAEEGVEACVGRLLATLRERGLAPGDEGAADARGGRA